MSDSARIRYDAISAANDRWPNPTRHSTTLRRGFIEGYVTGLSRAASQERPQPVSRAAIEKAAASLPILEPLEVIRQRHLKGQGRTGSPSPASVDRADLLRLVDTLRLELRLRLSDDAATAHDDAIEVMRFVASQERPSIDVERARRAFEIHDMEHHGIGGLHPESCDEWIAAEYLRLSGPVGE
jgi:hypothetical protein